MRAVLRYPTLLGVKELRELRCVRASAAKKASGQGRGERRVGELREELGAAWELRELCGLESWARLES